MFQWQLKLRIFLEMNKKFNQWTSINTSVNYNLETGLKPFHLSVIWKRKHRTDIWVGVYYELKLTNKTNTIITLTYKKRKWLLSLYSENNLFSYFHCGRVATSDGIISLARRRSCVCTRRPAQFPLSHSFFQNIILGFRQAKLCLRV